MNLKLVVHEMVVECKSCRHRREISRADCEKLRSPEAFAQFTLTVPPCPNCRGREHNILSKKDFVV